VSATDLANKRHMPSAGNAAGSVSRFLPEMTCVVREPTALVLLLENVWLLVA
jgi:hypothetical protein